MSSAIKRAPSRTNARASTGPKTSGGKAHSSQNARRHGLSRPVLSDPHLAKDVGALAGAIVGATVRAEMHAHAREFAAAQLDLHRVRAARHRLFVDIMSHAEWDSVANLWAEVRAILDPGRRADPPLFMRDLPDQFASKPEGADKFALLLSDKLHELAILDRYEKRALSKRKFALRALIR